MTFYRSPLRSFASAIPARHRALPLIKKPNTRAGKDIQMYNIPIRLSSNNSLTPYTEPATHAIAQITRKTFDDWRKRVGPSFFFNSLLITFSF